MDKKMRNLYLIHLLGLSAVLFVNYLFLREIFLFQVILLLFVWEIIVNLKYPVKNFPRYYLVNALGVLIFMSIIIFRQRGEIWFQWHWMLNYQGMVFVLIAPLFGYGIRRMLTDRKQTIYLAHVLVPSMIMLLIKVGSKGSVPGGTLLMVVLIIIIWQAIGSTRITSRNFWKFYLASVIGLVLLVMVFSYEQLFFLSLPAWIDENWWLLDKIWFIPLIGLGIGLIGRTKPINDGQGVMKYEQNSAIEINEDL